MTIKQELEKILSEMINSLYGLDLSVVLDNQENKAFGDYSSNICFTLSKPLKKSPVMIAEEIKSSLTSHNSLEKIDIAGNGFLNFFINKDNLTKTVLENVFKAKKYDNLHKTVYVEHTSVNPNKAMHVGHFRNSVIGDVLVNLHKKLGFNVYSLNWIDDTGVQVADTVNGLKNTELTESNYDKFDKFCWDVYTEINKKYENDQTLVEKKKNIIHKLEERNNELSEYADEVVEKVLDCHLEQLADCNILFDFLVYESTVIGTNLWNESFEKLKKSDNFVLEKEGKNSGCWVLKYSEKDADDKVFVRSDGTKVYTAKDTAYHLWKFGLLETRIFCTEWLRKFRNKAVYKTTITGQDLKIKPADKIINVIDERQSYPQDMVKLALKSLGFKKESENYDHVAYGVVSLSKETAAALGIDVSDNKKSYAMSGRKGIGVKLYDLIELLEKEVHNVQKSSEDKGIVGAKDIAIGALKHYILKYNPSSALTFDYKQALQLVGNTGPYLMYSHARASNILSKAGSFVNSFESSELSLSENELIKSISKADEVYEKVLADYNLSALAEYAFELAKHFHAFYENNEVLKSDKRDFRLTLVSAFKTTIADVLEVMGIVAPERM